MGQKPLGCHRAWREGTVVKAKRQRAPVLCAKIKGFYFYFFLPRISLTRMYFAASDDTSKKSRLKQFFSLRKTPPGQNKTARTAGGRAGPLYWTKGPSIIAGGKEGGQNSNRGTMALWESKLAHIRTPKECMANQTTEKNPQITLNRCSLGVSDKKGFY